jgi:hypothetical protein
VCGLYGAGRLQLQHSQGAALLPAPYPEDQGATMIHFKPEVQIGFFRTQLLCMLLNASMFSNRTGINLHVSSIDDGTHPGSATNTTDHGLSLAMDLNVDSGKAEDREALYQYLRKVMPRDYDVIAETDHVHVQWDIHRPEQRIKNV